MTDLQAKATCCYVLLIIIFWFVFTILSLHVTIVQVSLSLILYFFMKYFFTANAAKETMLPYFPQIVEYIKVIILLLLLISY